MLPRSERKEIAVRHGHKTIGEFEEYMSLERAVGETATSGAAAPDSASAVPYDNQLAYAPRGDSDLHRSRPEPRPDPGQSKLPSSQASDQDDDEEEKESDREEEEDRLEAEQLVASSRDAGLSSQELVRVGGSILVLPEETLHRVFDWLPVDAYATLARVSPHWKPFTRTEAAYRRLCERLYLNQSRRRALHVHRFDNSYRTMLERRPRVRAGGGVYVLKYTRVQPIQRDMWTEVRNINVAAS
jgi:F-box protein 9